MHKKNKVYQGVSVYAAYLSVSWIELRLARVRARTYVTTLNTYTHTNPK